MMIFEPLSNDFAFLGLTVHKSLKKPDMLLFFSRKYVKIITANITV